MEHNEHCGAFA